jgi:hypothetical protein
VKAPSWLGLQETYVAVLTEAHAVGMSEFFLFTGSFPLIEASILNSKHFYHWLYIDLVKRQLRPENTEQIRQSGTDDVDFAVGPWVLTQVDTAL